MLKQLLIILFLCSVSFSAVCQDWQWTKEAGGANYEESKSIAVDVNGNSYVTGTYARLITFGTTTLTGSVDGSTYVAKYDSNGSLVWLKSIEGTSVFESTDIAIDSNGSPIITGNFKGSAVLGAFTLSSPNDRSTFIVKFDTGGEVVWARKAGSNEGDVTGENITVDDTGNVYVTGNFFNSASFGTVTITATKDEQLFIAKYSSNGEVVWVKMAGGLGSCSTHDITTDRSGNIYLAGQFWLTAVFGTTTLSNYSDVTKPSDIFIAKYDASGNALWAKQAGGTTGNEVAAGITVDAEGNSYITGFYQTRASFGSTIITGNAVGNIFLAKYNTSGNLQWVKKHESSSDARGVSIDRDNDGNLYVAGHFEGSVAFGSSTLVSYGSYDMFFAKYDATGNVTGAIRAGGDGIDLVKKLQVSSGGGIYFTGDYTDPATFGAATLTEGIVVGKLNSISYDTEPAPTITTEALTSSTLCKGSTVEIHFTTTGRFGKDNTFTVQLSSSSGSFFYPENIGTGSASPIAVTIPTYLATGTGYKVRVVASSPAIIGTSNNSSLSISSPPVVTASVSSKVIAAGSSTNLYAAGADSYVWSPATGLSDAQVANPVARPQVTTTYTVTGTKNGCTSTATVIVKVEPLPAAGSAFEWASVTYGRATRGSDAAATVSDAEGNVYVAGHFSDEITFGQTTLTVPGYVGYDQIFIVKYDASGQVLWAKDIGGNNNDHLVRMALDKQGNLYLTGWFDPSITLGTSTFEGGEGIDYFIAKLDPNGNHIWANQIKGALNDVMALATGPNGEAYISGTFGGTASFNNFSLESSAIKDYFLVKYNAAGEVEWAESIKGTSTKGYRLIHLATDSEGNIYATGCFNKGTLILGSVMLTSGIEYNNSFFAKYNPEGQVQWAKLLGQEVSDYSHTISGSIIIDNNDRIYLSGGSNKHTKYDGVSFADLGVSGHFLGRFDTDGSMVWVTEAGSESISSLVVDAEGFIYGTGQFNNAATFGTRQFTIGSSEYAAFVAKYDAQGNNVWAEYAKTNRFWDVMSSRISVDNKQNVYMVGLFDKSGYHDPVSFGCHTIRNELSGGQYYIAKLSPIEGPVPALVTGSITSGPICAGAAITVPFTVTGSSAACASYAVLLSDAQGSFTYAKIIGSGDGTGGHISATIPANTVSGSGYRVKVIGTAPAVTGTDNGADLIVAALPVVSIIASVVNPCPGTSGIKYTASSADPISSYAWSVPVGWTITEGQGTNRITVTMGANAGEVTVTVRGACGPEVTKSIAAGPSNTFVPTLWSTSTTICRTTNTVFIAGGAPYGATYRWYASATDTEPIWEDPSSGSESRFYTPVVSATTNFYVSIRSSSGCEGERVQLTINVSTMPEKPDVIIASTTKPCVGTIVTYEVPAVSRASGYNWSIPYDWAIISGQGTSSITVQVGYTSGHVSVTAYNYCGTSAAQSLAVELETLTAPIAKAEPRCGAGGVTINATGAPTGASYNWYTSSSGGTPIATGSSYTTPVLTEATTYYVSAVSSSGCGESARSAVTVTVNFMVAVNAGSDETVCAAKQGYVLQGAEPAGGIWSGTGVTANGWFGPATAGVGTHALTYTYIGSGGCSVSDTKTIVVLEAPVVTLADFGSVCNTVREYVLTGGQPAGGVYSGAGVEHGLFTPVDTIGSYNITYTYSDAVGCEVSVTKVLTVSNCTGITESKQASKLTIYPNPAKTSINIHLPLPTVTDISLLLFDAKGRKLYEQNYVKVHEDFNQVLSLKDKPKGVYLLQLILNDGVITRRVIVE